MSTTALPTTAQPTRLWPRALGWLLVLGPLFFISYGAVNAYTATRSDVGQFVFAWEQQIPFWDWTIVPYMSIDLLYALSLFLCTRRQELDRHGLRLLLATLISVTCFLLWPLQFTFVRPDTEGLYGLLFDLLTSFDQPYNQAPSLHISLLVLIWGVFHRHLRGRLLRGLMHGWMALIGLSVLTTWQHHVIDVVGGLAVALLLLYLIPQPPLRWTWCTQSDPANRRLAYRYGGAGLLLAAVALYGGGWELLLGWPALSLGLVSLAYAGAGVAVFQHQQRGMSTAALVLLAPYLAGARLSAWWFGRQRPGCVEVVDGVWLGRVPNGSDCRTSRAARVLNVTAEMAPWRRAGAAHRRVPLLDLVAPRPEQLDQAVVELDHLARGKQPVLVHCALGLSRSALVVAGWLWRCGHAATLDDALAWVSRVRPDCVIGDHQRAALYALAEPQSGNPQPTNPPGNSAP